MKTLQERILDGVIRLRDMANGNLDEALREEDTPSAKDFKAELEAYRKVLAVIAEQYAYWKNEMDEFNKEMKRGGDL